MPRSQVELGEIFRHYGPAYRTAHAGRLSRNQRRVMHAIERCRTAALGGHVEQCEACHHQRIAYNSCRNRHCAKCQALASARWLAARQAEVLPVPYFHVVFTLPAEIAAIAYQNKAVVYALLFRAVRETLQTIAADPKHLGAELGFLAVLHTWGQTLLYHPHLHCIVPGGGLAPEGQRWIACRPGFLFPVRVLSHFFRGRFLALLQEAFDQRRLQFFSSLAPLVDASCFAAYLAPARAAAWVVYAKPPFGGPQQVLDYLGRYTHRVAIANHRLVASAEGTVSFHWRDYRHHNKRKVMTLSADEFLRRFLLHVLPAGFHRIRHYGFLGNRCRVAKLAQCRRLCVQASPPSMPVPPKRASRVHSPQLTGRPFPVCPVCTQGSMVRIALLAAMPLGLSFLWSDTS
jgi:putative transposase/transposase-like zinc-binding protein